MGNHAHAAYGIGLLNLKDDSRPTLHAGRLVVYVKWVIPHCGCALWGVCRLGVTVGGSLENVPVFAMVDPPFATDARAKPDSKGYLANYMDL